MQTNNGLQKADGVTPSSDSWLQTQEANLSLSGKINTNTDYKVRFSLLNAELKLPPLLEAYGTQHMGMFSWTIGRQQVMQGGWDNWNDTSGQHAMGVYTNGWAFDKFADALTFNFNVAGQVSLQLVNDVTKDDAMHMGYWNKNAHPTYIVGWNGNFGPISPLLHIGTYDNQKSKWFDLGIKTSMSGLNAYLDFTQNTMSHAVADGDKMKSKEDVATAITLYAAYNVKKTVMPWLYYSSYDVKQYEDKTSGAEDMKGNSMASAAAEMDAWTKAGANWDSSRYFMDNGSVFGIGADLTSFGDNWAPYLAIVQRSGKFLDPADSTKTDTKSEMMIKLGAYGTI
jgi:hypothetical protein